MKWHVFLAKAVFILLIPVLEFILMRCYIRDCLGVHLGYRAGTDYDFVPQSVLAYLLLLWVLEQAKRALLSFSPARSGINALLLTLFLGGSSLCRAWLSYAHPVVLILWFALAVSTILSGFFLFLGPSFYATHPSRISIIPGILLAGSSLISKTVFDFLWPPVLNLTGIMMHNMMTILLPGVAYDVAHVPLYNAAHLRIGVENYSLFIYHGVFTMMVGKGCAGLDGIFFFLFAIGLLSIVDRKVMSGLQWILFTATGVIFMYLLNLVRLVLTFLTTVAALAQWGGKAGGVVFDLCHNNLGWIFYGLGIAFFLRLILVKNPAIKEKFALVFSLK